MYKDETLQIVGALSSARPSAISSKAEIIGDGSLEDLGGRGFDPVGVFWQAHWLDTILSFGAGTALYGINKWGKAVGMRGVGHDFDWAAIIAHRISGLWSGPFEDLDLPAGLKAGSRAADISDAGYVCGSTHGEPRTWIFDTYARSVVAWIDPPSTGKSCYPEAINNVGEVVGGIWAYAQGGPGFVFSNGSVRTLGNYSVPWDINDNGIACGNIYLPKEQRHLPVRWDTRSSALQAEALPLLPGFDSGTAKGINNQGTIVGTCSTGSKYAAFVYENGVTTELTTLIHDPFWRLEDATCINDAGQICVTTPDGEYPTNYLLTPEIERPSRPEAFYGWLLGGVARGSGGFLVFPNGRRVPIPPHGPKEVLPGEAEAWIERAIETATATSGGHDEPLVARLRDVAAARLAQAMSGIAATAGPTGSHSTSVSDSRPSDRHLPPQWRGLGRGSPTDG